MISAEHLMAVIEYFPATGDMVWRATGKRAGCRRADGYVVIRIDGVLYYRHRLAWVYMNGCHPEQAIDHINGVKGDDRLENLRDVDIRTNSENQRKPKLKTSAAGFLGVQKNHSGWQAVIWVKGERLCLGTYKTPEIAHSAYVAAKREMHDGCTI